MIHNITKDELGQELGVHDKQDKDINFKELSHKALENLKTKIEKSEVSEDIKKMSDEIVKITKDLLSAANGEFELSPEGSKAKVEKLNDLLSSATELIDEEEKTEADKAKRKLRDLNSIVQIGVQSKLILQKEEECRALAQEEREDAKNLLQLSYEVKHGRKEHSIYKESSLQDNLLEKLGVDSKVSKRRWQWLNEGLVKQIDTEKDHGAAVKSQDTPGKAKMSCQTISSHIKSPFIQRISMTARKNSSSIA